MYYAVMAKRSIVADQIEKLLVLKDMSITELSEASKVSVSAISNILNGMRKQPRSDTVQKIAKGFPTSTDYLNGKTDNHEPVDAPPLPEYAAEVLESMRKLDQARNYELFLIAKGFVEANDQIRRLSREEFMEMMLDATDEADSPEITDRFMEIYQRLERKQRGDDNGTPPTLPAPPPSEPSE